MPNIAGVLNEEAAPPKPAYEGYVETVRWSGCAALILEPDGLRIETLFDQEAVAFADIEAVAGDTGSVRAPPEKWGYRNFPHGGERRVVPPGASGGL